MTADFYVDDLNINDQVNFRTSFASDPFSPAPVNVMQTPHGTRPGGTVTVMPPGVYTFTLTGFILGDLYSGQWEARRAALVQRLMRPLVRLRAGFTGDRFIMATPVLQPGSIKAEGPHHGSWSADFICDDPYHSALFPSGTSQDLTLTREAGTNTWSQTIPLEPGGDAPSPLRLVLTLQAGSVTPTRWIITNQSVSPHQIVTWQTTAGAGTVTVLESAPPNLFTQALGNVLLYHPFEDSLSDPFLDFSGAGRDSTYVGAVGRHEDGPITSDGRHVGSALRIIGTNGYLSNTAAALGVTGDLAVGAWFRTDVPNTAQGLLGKASTQSGFLLHKTAANVFEAVVGNSATTLAATGTRVLELGQWYHVVLVYVIATSTLTLFVNGAIEAQAVGSFGNLTAGTNEFRIGAPFNLSNVSEPANGLVAEPFVLNAALTAGQAQSIIRHGLPGYNASAPAFGGRLPWVPGPMGGPHLYPAAGTTNAITIAAEHPDTAPLVRLAASSRGRFF